MQELSDYVGLSPYHLDQSFKMIVGQSPEEYARARRMTIAATDVIHGASRLMDVAKNIAMRIQMTLRMILVIFMGFHLSKLNKKMSLNFKRDYILNYQRQREHHIHIDFKKLRIFLVGYSRFIPTKHLSNPFNVPDF